MREDEVLNPWKGAENTDMDTIVTGIIDEEAEEETITLAFSALGALAREMPLEVILLELRGFYRNRLDGELCRTCPDYRAHCDRALHALDAALWRLESESA